MRKPYETLPDGVNPLSNKVRRMSVRRQKIALFRRNLGEMHRHLRQAIQSRFPGHEVDESLVAVLGQWCKEQSVTFAVERSEVPGRVEVASVKGLAPLLPDLAPSGKTR